MSNKDLRPTNDITLFLNKLELLLTRLRTQFQDGTFSTQQEVIDEFKHVVSEFYSTLREPFLKSRPVLPGTIPSIASYNANFSEIDADLDILYREVRNIETILSRNFNFMVSFRDHLLRLMKRVGSKVGDYMLYNDDPLGGVVYFGDSFNDTSKTDIGSALLTKKQCNLDAAEGIITLPISAGGVAVQKAKVKLNAVSNGSMGNYQQIGAGRHDDINDILDGNPDTWFEYERVQRILTDQDVPLLLDLTLYFDKPTIVNQIRVNPNNFGTQTPIEILSIDTSYDGKVWTSIRDDIPVGDYLQEDEENIFILAPSTNKFSGQGLFTFTPRKVQYVHVALRQSTAYPIETVSGPQWRYAIGIRDIELKAIKYETDGDIISLPFSVPAGVQKVTLLASENPFQKSVLADVLHQISPDDGATWHSISPQHRVDTTIPELVNFNTGAPDSVTTTNAVISLRHRMLLSRSSDKFKNDFSVLHQTIVRGQDLLSLPLSSPVLLRLTRPPISGSVSILNPLWGCRADPSLLAPFKKIVGMSSGQPGQRFQLPIDFKSGKLSRDEVVIWVNDDASWTRVGRFTGAAATDKWYTLSTDGELQFGDSSLANDQPAVPVAGAQIGFSLDVEALLPTHTSPHICILLFPTDGDKSNVSIYVLQDNTTATDRLVPGATVHRLSHTRIDSLTSTVSPVFETLVSYVDGSIELTAAGEYSIDVLNGIIYSYTPAPADTQLSVSYSYTPYRILNEDEWDFVVGADNLYNKISIRDSGYYAVNASKNLELDLGVIAGTKVINLGVRCIAPGTLRGITASLFGSGTTPREVPFQNGTKEFLVQAGESDLAGYYSVDYYNGKIYLAGAVDDPEQDITFAYTMLYAGYNIARVIDPSQYTVDTTSSLISVNEKEVLRVWGIRDSNIQRESLLKVIYNYVLITRESIEELEPYFSPIVKDYILKLLPQGVI